MIPTALQKKGQLERLAASERRKRINHPAMPWTVNPKKKGGKGKNSRRHFIEKGGAPQVLPYQMGSKRWGGTGEKACVN